MYKYEKALQQAGVDASKLSKGLKATLKELESSIEDLENAQSDEDFDGDIETIQESVADMDEFLAEKIIAWNNRKDEFAERAKKMHSAIKKKQKTSIAEDAGQSVNNNSNIPHTKDASHSASNPTKSPAEQEIPVITPEEVEDTKKGNGWMAWAVIGLIAVVTVGQVILKNRE